MNDCMNCNYKERDFWEMPCVECSEDTHLPNWEARNDSMKGMSKEDEFWLDYLEADELKRLKLVNKLSIFENGSCPMTATLLNSYLEDLLKAVGCFGYDEYKIPKGNYTNIHDTKERGK